MFKPDDLGLTDSIEAGFTSVPIAESECRSAVALCVVVRRERDPVAGNLVLLRRFSGGLVLLGCLRDAGGRVVDWLELMLPARQEGEREGNAVADEAWLKLDAALRTTDPAAHLRWADADFSSRPVFIDLKTMAPWHPAFEGQPLELCADDAALAAAGLPGYSLSAGRFAWAPGVADSLVALNEAAVTAGGRALKLPREDGSFAPLNPEGFRLIVRSFAPFELGDFAAILGGIAWRGPDSAMKPCRLSRAYRSVGDAHEIRGGGGHFFSAREGAAGLLLEALHLKLQLVVQCFELVREYVFRLQLPLLNITNESFRVRLGATGPELPLLWTARAMLVQPGDSVPLPVPNTQARFFRPRGPVRESIFHPEELTRPRGGVAKVRLRSLLPPGQDGIVVEGTINTPEALRVDSNELIQLALPLVDGAITLYGYLDSKHALARGEAGFRSIPLRLSEAEARALSGAVGVIFTQVPMEVQVPLSTPCDLYSLGVLALQIVFSGGSITLPEAKDALFSLAQAVATADPDTADLAGAVLQVVGEDPRWLDSLGPQHLLADNLDAATAADLVPIRLWKQILAELLRLFPGRSPFAYCKDFGDAPPLALQAVFDRALPPLKGLLRLTRSVHVMDWKQNRELSDLIAGWMRNA